MTKHTKNPGNSMSARRWCEFVVFVCAVFAFGCAFSSCAKTEEKAEIITTETLPADTPEISPAPPVDPNADFSKFEHTNAEHARFPCALCHERKDNSATPKLSGHVPCASCHTEQFADNKSAICTICHTDTDAGAVKAFPALKSFNAVFDHARHRRQANCADCHKPLKNGVALSIPKGLNAHNACFQCHTPDAKSGEQEINSCGTCHQTGRFVKVSESRQAYTKTPFSHAGHRFACTDCHTVRAGAAHGNQVSAPVAAMHFARQNAQSCAGCHNNKRAFGGDDFSDCRRCHTGNGFKFFRKPV